MTPSRRNLAPRARWTPIGVGQRNRRTVNEASHHFPWTTRTPQGQSQMKTFKQFCAECRIQSMTVESSIPELIEVLMAAPDIYDRVHVTSGWDADTWILQFKRPEE